MLSVLTTFCVTVPGGMLFLKTFSKFASPRTTLGTSWKSKVTSLVKTLLKVEKSGTPEKEPESDMMPKSERHFEMSRISAVEPRHGITREKRRYEIDRGSCMLCSDLPFGIKTTKQRAFLSVVLALVPKTLCKNSKEKTGTNHDLNIERLEGAEQVRKGMMTHTHTK